MDAKRVAIAIALALPLALMAQNDDDFEAYKKRAQQEYRQYSDSRAAEYAEFRRKANEEYAKYVEQRWQEMQAMQGIEAPAEPKPPAPPRRKEGTVLRMPVQVTYDSLVPLPRTMPMVEVPDIEIVEVEENEMDEDVDFFATKVAVRVARGAAKLVLRSVAEKEVARLWRQLAGGSHDALLQSCLRQRRAMQLCDWAFIQFCGTASDKLCGKHCNESVLLQAFILTQAGYRVRLAESGGHLVLLTPFDHTIYNYSYLNIDGLKYYVLDKQKRASYRVCRAFFPKERTASIAIAKQPKLSTRMSKPRTFVGGRYPNMKATVAVNLNLVDFYSRYPVSAAWDKYSHTSLSKEVKQSLYPALREELEGKSVREQVDMLLDFVQHAFDYQTDDEQFGYERPLFGDESFYYPYNDCEDRSIVFSILVRELLGLKVVLAHWPGHLGTAVAMGDDEEGDYFVIGGHRYIVCDPTYIGAEVGETMPQMVGQKAKIIVL